MTPNDLEDLHHLAPDDLATLAMAGWRIGAERCVACGGYHRVWGTLRAAGVVGGTEPDRLVLEPLLADLLRPGARVLAAGSADPGVLHMIVAAARDRPISVRVADLCGTPLEVISRLQPYPYATVTTDLLDLTRLEDEGLWDVIVSHSMLPFLPVAARAPVLGRLKRALAPGGRLVVAVRTSRGLADTEAADHDAAWIRRAQDKIAASGVTPPGPAEDFSAALAAYAQQRRARTWDLATPQDLVALLESAGLEVLQIEESRETTRLDLAHQPHVKRSYILVAR